LINQYIFQNLDQGAKGFKRISPLTSKNHHLVIGINTQEELQAANDIINNRKFLL
jgi:hypothetical protein